MTSQSFLSLTILAIFVKLGGKATPTHDIFAHVFGGHRSMVINIRASIYFENYIAYFSDFNAPLTYRGRIFRRLSWDWL